MAHRPSAYGEKVDIYSLAIIFFELYRPFATAMERAEAIDALKQGIFPDGFVERYPKEVRSFLHILQKKKCAMCKVILKVVIYSQL